MPEEVAVNEVIINGQSFTFCGMTQQLSDEARARQYKWANKRKLQYAIVSQLANIDMPALCRAGYDKIQRVCGLEFILTQNSTQADIVITTAKIDGPGSVLADHQLPLGNDVQLLGRFDRGEFWSSSRPVPPNTVPFDTTFLHESCHGCGLPHTQVPNSLMNPFLNQSLTDLTAWEIEELKTRYGEPIAPPSGPVPPTTPPTAPSPVDRVGVKYHTEIGYYIPAFVYQNK